MRTMLNANCVLDNDDEAVFHGEGVMVTPEKELIAQVFIQAIRDYLAGSGCGEPERVKHFQTARKFLMSNSPPWEEWRRSLLDFLDVDEEKMAINLLIRRHTRREGERRYGNHRV